MSLGSALAIAMSGLRANQSALSIVSSNIANAQTPGYVAEGKRLGHDLHIRIVRPLDGMHPAQLLGAHLVLILGR